MGSSSGRGSSDAAAASGTIAQVGRPAGRSAACGDLIRHLGQPSNIYAGGRWVGARITITRTSRILPKNEEEQKSVGSRLGGSLPPLPRSRERGEAWRWGRWAR